MRKVLIALLIIGLSHLALAQFPLPPVAPIPPTDNAQLFTTIPATVPENFTAEIYHSGSVSYSCHGTIEGQQVTSTFDLAASETKQLEFTDFTEGNYVINFTCEDVQGNVIGAAEQFTVVHGTPAPFSVGITVPDTVDTSFDVTVSHTSMQELTCELFISTIGSGPFSVPANNQVNVSYDGVPAGQYTLNGTCTDGTQTKSTTKLIEVVGGCTIETDCESDEICASGVCTVPECVEDLDCGTGYTCVAYSCTPDVCTADEECPGSDVCDAGVCEEPGTVTITLADMPIQINGSTVHIAYTHDAVGPLDCSMVLDASWSLESPYLRNATVQPSVWQNETYTGLSQMSHLGTIVCQSDPISSEYVFFTTVLDNETVSEVGGGSVTLYLTNPYNSTLNVTYLHNGTGEGACVVAINDDIELEESLLSSVESSHLFDPGSGIHGVEVTCNGTGWSASRSKSVRVNTSVQEYDLLVNTSKSTYLDTEIVTLSGEGFPPLADLFVDVRSPTRAENKTVTANNMGSFSLSLGTFTKGTYLVTVSTLSYPTLQTGTIFTTTSIGGGEPNVTVNEPEEKDPGQQESVQVSVRESGEPEKEERRQLAPIDEEPAPIIPGDEEKGSYLWLWIFFIVLILIGGLVGYLVYQGQIDVSSWDGFRSSVEDLVHKESTSVSSPASPASSPVKKFILAERAKGFDDLTIRQALIGRGWHQEDVDATFDTIYENQ